MIGIVAHHADAQEKWYYCGPAHAYYPYVSTCSVPWRQFVPHAYQQPSGTSPSPNTTSARITPPASGASPPAGQSTSPLAAPAPNPSVPVMAQKSSDGRGAAATPEPVNSFSPLGPSFDCAALHTPVAELICGSPALSRLDLVFVQAYYALRWQVGPSGWQVLKVEAVDFESAMLRQCGIPLAGVLPADTTPLMACVSDAEEQQRRIWISRLNGAAAEEAQRPIEQHVALQRDLQEAGYLPPTENIDGIYGAATRTAIVEWQQAQDLPPSGFLSDADAARLEQVVQNRSVESADSPSPPPAASQLPTGDRFGLAPVPSTASPPEAEAANEEAAPSTVDEVPLEEDGGIFVVPVQINGAITLRFVVDSGASDVQIPADVFLTLVRTKTIALSDLIGEQTYTLADGSTQEEPRFILRELKVGSYTLRNIPASVSPVSGTLLLGQSFLSRFSQWTLDNQQHALKLVEKSTEPVRPNPPLSPPSAGPGATAVTPAVPHQPTGGVGRFQVATCGSILDKITHLEWYPGPDLNIMWPDADKWAKELRACNETWTMPSIAQLKTLFDRKVVGGIGYFTRGRNWPAHIDPVFSGIGKGSWVWAQGQHHGDNAPAFNFNQGVEVEIPSTEFYGTVRVFAVRQAN